MNFIGKQIGNYQLVAAINSGGYGSVYRANHTILSGRTVAVKLLHTHLDRDEERKKFLQEACLLEQLSHRYILPILDVGFTDGLPYIVVEYAPGGSLRDRLKRQAGRPLPAEEARRLLMQVGQALEHAHQQNIIHRDLKPENILFNAQGEALLSDFGIATVVETSIRLTRAMGTPTYMAPEQFQGTVSKEVDQYALGCLAYELYTGHKVFEAPDQLALAVQHTTKAPTPPTRYNPQLPGHIEQAILRALAKERTARYPSISDFLHVLNRTPERESDVPPTLGTGSFFLQNSISEQPTMLLEDIQAQLNRLKEGQQSSAQPEHQAPDRALKRYNRGNDLYKKKQYEQALVAFADAVNLEPGNAKYQKALEEIRTQLKQEKAASLYTQGNILIMSKQYEQALAAFTEAVQLEPANVDYQNGRGRALYNLKRYGDALEVFKEAARLAPKVPDHFKWQGEALYQLKRYKDALVAFEKAALLDPQVGYYHKMQGEMLYELKRYEDALVAYEKLALLEPGAHDKRQEEIRVQLKQEKAAALYKQGNTLTTSKQYEQALVAYREAVQLEPDKVSYRQALGRTFSSLQRHEEALGAFKEAARLEPKVHDHLKGQGEALYGLKQYEKALQAFEKAAQLAPKTAYYYKMQGEALCQLKRFEDALKALEKAAQLEPGNLSHRKRQEQIRAQLNKQKAEKSPPPPVEPPEAQTSGNAPTYYNQGMALFKKKNYEQALVAFDKAVRLEPGNSNYQCARGRALYALNRYQEALASFDEAIHLNSRNHEAYFKKAEVLRVQGKDKEAEKVLAKARQVGQVSNGKKEGTSQSNPEQDQEGRLQQFLKHLLG